MRIITNLKQFKGHFRKPVVAIGIFDGIHLGHRKILREVVKRAREINGTGICLTFNPHPKKVLDIIGAPPFLISLKHRLNLIAREGIGAACVLDFNEIFAGYKAEEFVKNVLVKKLRAREVIVGKNFKFGRGKAGDIKLLKTMGVESGFAAREIPLSRSGGLPVSSTRIRRLVMGGELEKAAELLGRPVSILGTVVKGSKRGRLLGFPTANINPHHEAIPPSGVYAVYVERNGKRHKGVLNIGVRPTFKKKCQSVKVSKYQSIKVSKYQAGEEPVIEVHISGFNSDIYGEDIEVIFLKKLREERKFPGRDKLIEQIRIDEREANMVS